jgi:MFS family permease
MGFGILEDHRTPMPIGTVVLNDVFGQAQHIDPDDPQFNKLKKQGHIVLQPQPSDSPNDPLNWTPKHKYLMCTLLIITMVTVGATHGMITTGYRKLAEEFHVDFPDVVAAFTPPYVAAHSVALFFASATAAVWGRRILYVHAIILLWLAMLSGYFAKSLTYYTVVNTLSGVAAAPMELLLAPIITDTIYIHQRGRLMALSAVVGVLGGDARYVKSTCSSTLYVYIDVVTLFLVISLPNWASDIPTLSLLESWFL